MRSRLTLYRRLLPTTCLALIVGSAAKAQSNPLESQGVTPWGSYQHGDVDSVNLMNGGVVIHIPLYSLPQRGRLSLSFSIGGNMNSFHVSNACKSGCYQVSRVDGSADNPVGPRLNLDQALSAGPAQYRYPANSNTFYNVFSVQDATGANHTLGYDNSNLALLRALDGSGFLYAPATSTPASPFYGGGDGTVYTSAGIQHITQNSSSALPTITMKDPDGNSIVRSYTGQTVATSQITDSVGRVFPDIPNWYSQHTSSIAGCPAISAGYQTTTSSVSWTVPGPNGTPLTYLFCYATIYYHTNFFGGCTNGCVNTDTSGTIPALQSIVLPNKTYWAFIYDAANPASSSSIGYGQVTQIKLPTGGSISYQYVTFSTQCQISSAPLNYNRAVSARTIDAANGSTSTWNYNYSSWPVVRVADPVGNDTVYTFSYLATGHCDLYETNQQAYQGSKTTGKLLRTKATAYQSAATNPQAGSFDYPNITAVAVFPSTVTTTLDNGQAATITYQYNDGGFVDVQPACTVTGPTTYSCTNSATQQIPFGQVTSSTATDYGGSTLKTVQTQYLYQQNSSYYPGNFLGQIAAVTTLNGSGTQVAKTTYGFDENNGSPQGIFGHQTSVNLWLNTTGTFLTSKNVFNAQGMLAQSLDPQLNVTKYTYDSTGAFLSQVQRPDTISGGTTTQHLSNYTYDPVIGKPQTVKDENQKQTSYSYDNMGRITAANYPDGGQTSYCYTDSGGATCKQGQPPFQVVSTQKIDASQNKVTTTSVDGLGRLTQNLNSDSDGATYSEVTIYDGLGRPATLYNPTRCYPPTVNCETTWGFSTYQYDATGRTTQVTNPDGSTILTNYTGPATQVQDESNGSQRVTRISQTDALGRLTSVCEVAPGPFVGPGGASSASLIGSNGTPASCGLGITGTGFLTTYQYDALDNLLQVNQSGLAARTFTYDSLSRRVCASNPENSSAPCPATATSNYTPGTIGYTYDANGNLVTKTSPAPNQTGSATVTTTHSYDALNRLLSRTYSDGTTPASGFTYDVGPSWNSQARQNAIGRMTSSGTVSCVATLYDYDSMGRTIGRPTYRPNGCLSYPLNYTYDSAGNLTSETDGLWHTATYTYNTAGRLTSVTDSQNGANQPPNLLSGMHYNPLGVVISGTTGFGEIEAYGYDNRGRLKSSTITLNGVTTYSFNITSFAPNGDVLAVTDSVNGNWTYTYDPFNRLVGANQNNGGAVYSYVYDRFGNRWQQNGPQTMLLTFSGNNNRMDGYAYDAAGNVTNDGTHSYTYDAENRIVKVDGGNTATYTYDAEGNRAVKTNSSSINSGGNTPDPAGTVELLYDLRGRMVHTLAPNAGTAWRGEVYAGNRHLATYVGNAVINHADWLGTERQRLFIYSDSHSVMTQSLTSLPFGDWLAPGIASNWSPLNFTGKHHDFESGLDDFGARYYGSTIGRFMSPDPESAGSDPDDPQSWNAYAYVTGNPINSTDPDGLAPDVGACNKENDPHCGKADTTVTVTVDAPPQLPTSAAKIAQTWENAGKAAQSMVDAARVWLQTKPNAGCVAAATAAGAAYGASKGVVAGPLLQAALAFPTGGATEAVGGPAGGAALGALAGAGAGGGIGYAIGQIACRGGGGGSGSGGSGGVGATKQWKKLSQGEIKKLQDAGYDPHDLKPNARYDLYKNQNGDISVFPKANLYGPGDPTGLSIKNGVVSAKL
jgi:RHS repeat-associated protein